MSLAAGTRFGSYEVAEQIGSGGMGEVYRAQDMTLKRDVALKVLPKAFVEDVDRLARFQREAEILASLNHPNIATIHGFEKADDRTAIVMELVEGPTLADRIEQGPIPAEEAMGIASQVLAALEAAHARGIVHRDLKPANVKLRDDGTVKVLDFSISKPLDAAAISGGAAVATTPAVTQTGVILGTAAYMSPEQAQGKFVDQRTDIWAFGCLLFEMLTGQPAFGGENVMLTLARVLANETNLDSIPATISPAVRHTIGLCLVKDPKKRIHHIGDVRLALAGSFETAFHGDAIPTPAVSSRSRLGIATLGLTVGLIVMGTVGAVLWPEPDPKLVTRFEIPIPPDQPLRRPNNLGFALSPDGRRLVYNAEDGFYLRNLDAFDATRIPETTGDVWYPVFAADGEAIVFTHTDPDATVLPLERVPVAGGPVTTLARDITYGLPGVISLTRTPAGTWLLSHQGGVSEVDFGTGEVQLVLDVGEDNRTSGARLLPDGDTIVLAVQPGAAGRNLDALRIVAASRSAGLAGEAALTTLAASGFDPRYVESTGHLLFSREQTVYAVGFDPVTLSTRGEVRAVLTDVRLAPNNAAANYDVAANGTLAYLRGLSDVSGQTRLTWVWAYADGRIEPVAGLPEFEISPSGSMMDFPRLSPDGTRVSLTERFTDGTDDTDDNEDLWVYDLTRPGTRTLIAGTDALERKGVWTPDGRYLIFWRDGAGLYRRRADASDREELLFAKPDDFLRLLPDWVSPDGSELIVTALPERSQVVGGIYRLTLDGEARFEPVLDEPGIAETGSELSPDGRYIAYQTNESGRRVEIHIRPYPDVTSSRTVASTGRGIDPLWDAAGGYLYFADDDGRTRLLRVPVETSPDLVLGEPERLDWELHIFGGVRPNYDRDPAGDRWLVRFVGDLREVGAQQPGSIVVVENWTEWLREQVPVE